MIIRKPYAFLIKYFKIIHIILFVFMVYLSLKTRTLYIFFRDFLASGTYTYIPNMVYKYVSPLMIIAAIILVGLLLLIYFLMKQKDKKVLYYLMAVIFYFMSFIIFIYFFGVFNRLEYSSYNNQSLVIFRDLSMVLYYINYGFLVIAFIRGFGFNVKKFNFEKDLKELDITEEDREEIEISSGIDYENIGNFVRRRKRNFIYYIKENSYILIVFLVILMLSISSIVALNTLVFSKVYKEGEVISLNNLDYTITSSYLTDKDLYGNIIKKNKNYVIVAFNVKNKGQNNLFLNIENSRIKIGNEYYYPKKTLATRFSDLGIVYKNQSVIKNTSQDYILVFEIDNSSNNITFELYRGKEEVNGEAILYYRKVSLNPYKFKEINLGNYKVGDSIPLDKTYYQTGNFKIINYDILDIENYTYQKCNSETDCIETATVVPKGAKKILKIVYEINQKENIFEYLNITGNAYEKAENIDDITPDNYKDNSVLLEVPGNVNINNLVLNFNVRGVRFQINK